MLNDGEKGVVIQRDKKTYAVAPHIPCGVVTPETLRKLADVAEKYKIDALKITSAARIALIGLEEDEVDEEEWAYVCAASRPVRARPSANAARPTVSGSA